MNYAKKKVGFFVRLKHKCVPWGYVLYVLCLHPYGGWWFLIFSSFCGLPMCHYSSLMLLFQWLHVSLPVQTRVFIKPTHLLQPRGKKKKKILPKPGTLSSWLPTLSRPLRHGDWLNSCSGSGLQKNKTAVALIPCWVPEEFLPNVNMMIWSDACMCSGLLRDKRAIPQEA